MACPNCFSGHVHEGTPLGQVTKIHGRDTYVSEPKDGKRPKGVIVIVPDAFGWEFVNNRILADHYAAAGDYLVYLPEFMDGNAAPVSLLDVMPMALGGKASWYTRPYYLVLMLYSFIPFMISNRFSVSWPKVKSFFEAVRKNEAVSLPIGCAGFCWGGKHTLNFAHDNPETYVDGKPLMDAGFTAHPSNLVIPGEIEKVRRPVAIGIGDKDVVLPMAGVEKIKKIFESIQDVETEVKIYPGAGHGFAVRADLAPQEGSEAVKNATDSEEQAIAWFKRSFEKAGYKQ